MLFGVIVFFIVVIIIAIFFIRRNNTDRKAQRDLDKYLSQSFSPDEIGKFYERYIGHLYETDGYDVFYNGAVNGFADLGRDLIVKNGNDVLIVQTKCWSKNKVIQEKHIFQLFGSMTHFKLTSKYSVSSITARFYTTARYSDVAKEAARVLGVELRTEQLNRSYPIVKCNLNINGEKIYHLPFDPYYDKVKIDLKKDEYFVYTVKEAVQKGFRRAGKPNKDSRVYRAIDSFINKWD